MSDDRNDDDDPYAPPGFDPDEQGERSMSYFGAIGWMLLTLLIPAFPIMIVSAIRSVPRDDLVLNFGLQVLATLITLFLILRFYAPQVSIRHFLGLRGTHGAFYVIGAVLGVIIAVPATTLYELIQRRNPAGADQEKFLVEQLERGSVWHFIVFAIVVLAGPLLEELFFRGALFRPMRRENSPIGVILVSSVVFAFAHVDKNIFFPIALVGLTMGLLRYASGSLIPSTLMHITFNGVSFWSLYSNFRAGTTAPDNSLPPHWLIAASTAATLALVAAAFVLGARSQTARESRAEDLV